MSRPYQLIQSLRVALHVMLVSMLIGRSASAQAFAGHAGDLTGLPATATSGGPAASGGGVDTRTGSATYAYRFALPPGRDGMTPDLALTYSSEGGNSWVGRGFHLDTPTIRRDSRLGVPSYSTSDRFVFEEGGSVQTLVGPMPAVNGDDEYRLVEDEADTRFLLHTADNSWRIQTRDGRESIYRPSVALSATPTLNQVYSWRVEKIRDSSGNTITYEYATAPHDQFAPFSMDPRHPDAQVTRLRNIWYGGNEDANGQSRIEPLFHISFDYMGADPPPALVAESPRNIQNGCTGAPGRLDDRAGGVLVEPDGTSNLLFGIAVEVVAPGTTDGTRREYVYRRSHAWQFTYNWDQLGCRNSGNFWPALARIDSRGWDEGGLRTDDQPVTFTYWPWDRTLETRGPFTTPPASNFQPDPPPSVRPSNPSIGFVFSNQDATPPSPSTRVGTRAREAFADTGSVENLVDVDADGMPDLLDLGSNPSCFGNPGGICFQDTHSPSCSTPSIATPTNPNAARWFRFGSPSPVGAGVHGFAQTAQSWSWDQSLLYPDDERTGTGDFNCALEPRRTDVQQTTIQGVSVHPQIGQFIDIDGDGYLDILRQTASADAPLRWYRNSLGNVNSPAVGYLSIAQIADPPWAVDTFDVPGLSGRRMTSVALEQVHATANTCNAIEVLAMVWTSSEAGFLADFTGDGRPDRIAAVHDGSDISLAVWPSTGAATWGSPSIWRKAATSEGGMFLSPAASVNPQEDISPSTCGPLVPNTAADSQSFIVSRTLDMNGDGLFDIVTSRPLISRYPNTSMPDTLSVFGLAPGFSYGNGFNFYSSTATNPWPRSVMPPSVLGMTRYEYNVPGWSSSQWPGRARTTIQVADYNGDGLPDLLSSETSSQAPNGWVALNRGSAFGPAYALNAVGDDTRFENVAVQTDDAFARTATQQVVDDFTGDGRADILYLDFKNGNGGQYYVITDVDNGAAPGRLHVVDNGRGASTEFEYETLAAAVGYTGQGVPAHHWVVRRQTAHPTAAESIQTTYGYTGPQFLPDPAVDINSSSIFSMRSFHGFTIVVEHQPRGLDIQSTYAYSTYSTGVPPPDGLLTQQKYTNVSNAALLRQISWTRSEHTAAATSGQLSVRHQLDAVTTVEYPAADGNSFQHAMAYTYAGTSLPQQVTETGGSSVARTTTLAYATPAAGASPYRLMLKEQALYEGSMATGTPIRHTQYYYDGLPYGQFGAGALSRIDSWRDASNVITTTVQSDSLNHPTQLQGPNIPAWGGGSIPTQRICWDAFGLYPVQTQGVDRLVTNRVVSYVTGATLVSSGPVGLDNSQLINCPPPARSYSWASRTAVPALPKASVGTDSPTPAVQPAASGPSERVVQGGTTTDEVVVPRETIPGGAGAATAERALRAIETVPYVAPTAGLGSAPPAGPPATVGQPTAWMTYDGLGRALSVYGTQNMMTPPGAGVPPTPGQFDLPILGSQSYLFDGTHFWTTTYRNPDGTNAIVAMSGVDGAGRPFQSQIYDWNASTWRTAASYFYDANGDLSRVDTQHPSAPATIVSTSVLNRDVLGRPTQIQYPDGSIITRTIAERHAADPSAPPGTRITDVLNSSARTLQTEYDPFGRTVVSRAFGGLSGTTSPLASLYTYDAADALSQVTDPDGAVTVYGRDFRGLPLNVSRYYAPPQAVASPSLPSDQIQIDYDDAGEAGKLTDHVGYVTTYQRDMYGRLVVLKVPPVSGLTVGYGDQTYVYSADPTSPGLGQLSSITGGGETLTFTYDGAGRVAREQHAITAAFNSGVGPHVSLSDAYAFDFAYDRLDRPTSVAYDVNNTNPAPSTLESIAYRYLCPNRASLSDIRSVPTTGAPISLAAWTFNDAGSPVTRTDSFGGTETRAYDAAGRLAAVSVADSRNTSTWTQSATFLNGFPRTLITQPTMPGQSAWSMLYDTAGRLRTVSDSHSYYNLQEAYSTGGTTPPTQWTSIIENTSGFGGTSNTYGLSYEAAPSSGPTHNDPDAIASITVNGSAGRSISRDLNGAVAQVDIVSGGTPRGKTNYTVDPYGNIRQIKFPDGHVNQILYDAFGQRSYVYNGATNQVTATRGSLLDIVYKSGTSTRSVMTYLGSASGRPVARVNHGVSDSSMRMMHYDLFGDVVHVRSSTDTSGGTTPNRFDYGPYGPIGAAGGSSPSGELRGYRGGLVDPAGGPLVQFGARVYDPYSRQWMVRDPLSRVGVTALPYDYAAGNPFAFDDPSGLDPDPFVDVGEPSLVGLMTGEVAGAWNSFWAGAQTTVAASDHAASAVEHFGVGTPSGMASPPGPQSLIAGVVRFPADAVSLFTGADGRGGTNSFVQQVTRAVGFVATASMIPNAGGGSVVADSAEGIISELVEATEGGSPAADELVTLYRGVSNQHARYADALRGIAEPRGGAATIFEHVMEGNTDSIYTSWSEVEETASDFALNGANKGVVMRSTFSRSRLVASPNRFGESEWLVPGRVEGADTSIVTQATRLGRW